MKKILFHTGGNLSNMFSRKILIYMRNTLFLLFITAFNVFADDSYSQNAKVNLDMKEVPVAKVLSAIEEQSEFYFLFNAKLIDVNRNVTVKAENAKISDILSAVFKNDNVDYIVYGRQIILSPKNEIKGLAQLQQFAVSGKVTSASTGEPLPGVTIVVKGTTIGTISDMDGHYFLSNVPPNATLVFSFVGMKTQEIVVGNQTNINVALVEEAIGIEEVVAVGYQTKQKSNLTGSVSIISSEQIENRPVARLTQVLPGLAPGLIVTRNNPGRIGTSDVGLRIGGITSRSNPDVLVVIDGVPQESSSVLNTINPGDIESVSVLKDAEAAIYGSRASGGVIVITTKRGKGAKLSASVSSSFMVPHIYRQTTNMFEMFELQEEGWKSTGVTPMFGYPYIFQYIRDNHITFNDVKNNDFKYVIHGNAPFPDCPYLVFGHTDWMKVMYGTAKTQNYNVSAQGSSEKTNYYASVGVVDEGSMLRYGNNSSRSYYMRLKYEYTHNNLIKIGANLALRYQNWVEPQDYGNIQWLAAVKFTFDHPYTPKGNYMNWGGYQNPIGWAEKGGDIKRAYYDLQPQLYAEITPSDNLNIRINIAKNANFTRARWLRKQFQHYYWDDTPSFPSIQPDETQVGAANSFNQNFDGNMQVIYKNTFNEKHHINILGGVSHEEFQYDNINAYRNNLVFSNLYTLNLGDSKEQFNNDSQSEYALNSAYGNIGYSYTDRYNIELTARYDGSSRFAEGYKWKPFFGAGASWIVTNERFIKNLNFKGLNNFKIRATWGQLGNQNSIGLYDFVSRINISQSNLLMGDPSAPVRLQVATLQGLPSYTRTWEMAEKSNIGFDVDMLNYRLNSTFNYFIADNKNMFYQEEFPAVLGTTPPTINGAHIKTHGWDFSLNWSDKIRDKFGYHITFGISDAKTKVISLSDSRIIRYGYNGFVEGYPVGTVFGLVFDGFIKDDNDLATYNNKYTAGITRRLRPGDAKYKDLDNDGILELRPYKTDANGKPTSDCGDLINLGDMERHYEYYSNIGFNWKGFDFEILLVGVGKWMAFDQNPANYAWPWVQPLKYIYGNTWRPDRTNAKYPRFYVVSTDFNAVVNTNNYYLSDAPYMRYNVPYLAIKNINFGYSLPQGITKRIRLEKIYIYCNIADFGYLINKMPKGYSPEQPFNSNLTPYPQNYSFGININF